MIENLQPQVFFPFLSCFVPLQDFCSQSNKFKTDFQNKVTLFEWHNFYQKTNNSWQSQSQTKKIGKRSELRKLQRQKPKRTSKNLEMITTSKCVLSWSLLRHHYYDKKRLSTLWFYLWHQKRSQRQKSKISF